ncbi:hypothetical protein D3C79_753930 [compost metagenome]
MVVDHRVGQPAEILQLVVGTVQQRRHRVVGEKLGRDPFVGRFPGHRLGAVFAELESRPVLLVGPRAAWAVETVRLVGAHQGDGRLERVHLLSHCRRGRFQRTPATCGAIVITNTWYLASISHGCSKNGLYLAGINTCRVVDCRYCGPQGAYLSGQ